MSDWPTIGSLAAAGGTLVLAMATFASVRSANRAARVAEEFRAAATVIGAGAASSTIMTLPTASGWVSRRIPSAAS